MKQIKRNLGIVLIVAAFFVMGGCKSTVARWQEQYDLGVRYLSDGEYEEAIIAFNAAIEIDPMQADAYLNLANAYIGMNDFDAAREILERGYELTQSKVLKAKLEELDSGNIFDYWGNPRKRSGYDGVGNLKWYHIYTYDKKQTVSVSTYNASGVQTGHWDGYRYDEDGRMLKSGGYSLEDGIICAIVESIYDEQGYVVRTNHFGLDGSLQGYSIHENDGDGRHVRICNYTAKGNLQSYHEYAFEGTRCVGCTSYTAEGTLIGREEFCYDEQGRQISIIHYGPDGEVLGEQASEH